AWVDVGLVFDRGDGQLLSVNYYNQQFHAARERLGLPKIRPHDLRHSASSLALTDARLPMMLVSRMLGHADIGTTVDLYGHLSVEQQIEAARVIESVVWGQAG